MKTIKVAELRQERDRLTKRIDTINQLLTLVDSLDGVASKKPGRPAGTRRKLSPEALERIRQGQKKRRAKERAAKKAAGKSS